jgi:hypothetical protein
MVKNLIILPMMRKYLIKNKLYIQYYKLGNNGLI